MEGVFFHFQQAGGVNALLPLIRHWRKRYRMVYSGSPVVRGRFEEENISFQGREGANWLSQIPHKGSGWLRDLDVGLVVSDTINLARSDNAWQIRRVWRTAHELGVPVAAYVDSWWAYRRRFVMPGENELPAELPNTLAVVDELARRHMLRAGLPKERVKVLGSPRFSGLRGQNADSRQAQRGRAREELALNPSDLLICFVSQPLEKNLCSVEPGWGLDEKQTLAALLEALHGLDPALRNRVNLMVLMHPEDDENALREIAASRQWGVRISFGREDQRLSKLKASDLVTGIFSILLTEAVIMGLPVLSIQIGMENSDMLITNLVKATRPVRSRAELPGRLIPLLTDADHREHCLQQQESFVIVDDSLERWDAEVKTLLRKAVNHA